MVVKQRTAKGTPFITNVEKEVYGKRKEEQEENQPKEGKKSSRDADCKEGQSGQRKSGADTGPRYQPTLKLEMYAPPPPPKKPQPPMGTYPMFVPKYDPALQRMFGPSYALSYGPNVELPIQNVYNITLPGPSGGHIEMNRIFEDILPVKDPKFSSTTLGERLQMYDYIRQILICVNDGEDISIDSQGHRSLLSYIKFMEINPNYYSPLFKNPYKGLPYGLLIYRSCFPIRFEPSNSSITCAKNSIGLNIRLYCLNYAEYYSYLMRQPCYTEYDVWRELTVYEYIRENILKKKQCPNFPILYAFFFCHNRRIDFFSLKKNCLTQRELLTREFKKFMLQHKQSIDQNDPKKIIRPMTMNPYGKNIQKLPDEMDPELQVYSGTLLISITEAPNQNLYQWASRKYERDGIVQKMISHGFHDENVWISIIFQIIAALYVLQLHGIYFRDMTIADSVYIKDLASYGEAAGYWKYIINGVSYYVPNYGYLVMIDSNYKDIVPDTRLLEKDKREYKIYTSNIVGEKYPLDEIQKKVFENYRRIINTNAFTYEHTQNNVVKPPESVMKMIGEMMNDNSTTNLGDVLSRHFTKLMNNRIGTLLRKDEVQNIRETTGRFKEGELAVQVVEEELYKWVLVGKINNDMIEIVTRNAPESDDFIRTTVRTETLKQYSSTEKIEQNFTGTGSNLTEEKLLETYLVN